MKIENKAVRVVAVCAAVLVALPALAGAQAYVKNNNFGVGTADPQAPIHALSEGDADGVQEMFRLTNNGPTYAFYEDTFNGRTWALQPTGNSAGFTITLIGSGGSEFLVKTNGQVKMGKGPNTTFDLLPSGDLTITGSINTADCSPCMSDYVFEPEYELMPLDELAEFVAAEKHLPNVPSQTDVDKAGKLNMTEMQMRMLEKIEELVLYTIDQQRTIDELTERLQRLER